MKSEIASEKQTDLDKSVKEIEELLSQKYGSSPYESSVNYDQSDSDFNPWESSKNSEGASPTRKPKSFSFGQVVKKKKTKLKQTKPNYIKINLHQ